MQVTPGTYCDGGSKPAPELTITLLGQALVAAGTDSSCADICSSAQQLHPLLNGSDVVFTALESAIYPDVLHHSDLTHFTHPARRANPSVRHVSPRSVLNLLRDKYHVNLLATCSNHTGDLQRRGIMWTQTALEQHQLNSSETSRPQQWAGLGSNIKQAAAARVLQVTTADSKTLVSVALIACATTVPQNTEATNNEPGVNPLRLVQDKNHVWRLHKRDRRRVLNEIKRACKHSDIVLLYHHNHGWLKTNASTACSSSSSASSSQHTLDDKKGEHPVESWRIAFARAVIDAGATVYVAHGEPFLQGIENYHNGLICYGLGNFVFQTRKPGGFYHDNVWESCAVQMHWKQLINTQAIESVVLPLRTWQCTRITLHPLLLTPTPLLSTTSSSLASPPPQQLNVQDISFIGVPHKPSRVRSDMIRQRMQRLSQHYGPPPFD